MLLALRMGMYMEIHILRNGKWTDPVLFIGFLVLRPLFTFFVGVFAYLFIGTVTGASRLITSGTSFLGSALFIMPTAQMKDLGWLIHDGREHYEALKHIYLASPSLPLYLVGRSLASFLNAALSFVVTLFASDLVIRHVLRIDVALLSKVDLPALILAFILGYFAFTASASACTARGYSLRPLCSHSLTASLRF